MSTDPDYEVFAVAKRRYNYNLELIVKKYSKQPAGLTEWDLDTDQIFLTREGTNASEKEIERELRGSLCNSADFGFSAFSSPCVNEEMSDSRKRRIEQHNQRVAQSVLNEDLMTSTSLKTPSEFSDKVAQDTFCFTNANAMLNREFNPIDGDEEENRALVLNELFSSDELAKLHKPDETEPGHFSKTLPTRFYNDDDLESKVVSKNFTKEKDAVVVLDTAPIASRLRRRTNTVSYSSVKRRKTR